MKIYIITDLEGVAGVVNFEQTYETGKYNEKAKELLTEEVNACCDGLGEAGVDEMLFFDSHGPGFSIFPEKLHYNAKLFHGGPTPISGKIGDNWDGVFLLGRHSMNGTKNGNLNHTYSSKSIVKMELNGEEIGEIGIEVYLSGWFNIPVVFVSGDEAACEEAGRYVPEIEQAVVKWGINRTCAISLSPIKAREIIKEKSKKAIEKIDKIKPVKIERECELIVEFISTADAHIFLNRPFFEKINETTIRVHGKDFLDVYKKYFY